MTTPLTPSSPPNGGAVIAGGARHGTQRVPWGASKDERLRCSWAVALRGLLRSAMRRRARTLRVTVIDGSLAMTEESRVGKGAKRRAHHPSAIAIEGVGTL